MTNTSLSYAPRRRSSLSACIDEGEYTGTSTFGRSGARRCYRCAYLPPTEEPVFKRRDSTGVYMSPMLFRLSFTPPTSPKDPSTALHLSPRALMVSPRALMVSPRALFASSRAPAFHLQPRSGASAPRRRSSNSLLGSFQESLLSGRMSGTASTPLLFTVKIGITVNDTRYRKFERQAQITVPFEAVFYKWQESSLDALSGPPVTQDSPYVGEVDLEKYYVLRQDQKIRRAASIEGAEEVLARFPGYNVPRTGKLQLVIFNQERTVCNFHLIDYSLELDPGEKTWIRHTKTARTAGPDRTHLLSVVNLQFARIGRKYYLFRSVKIVFHNRIYEKPPVDKKDPLPQRSAKPLVDTEVITGGCTALGLEFYHLCGACRQSQGVTTDASELEPDERRHYNESAVYTSEDE